MASNQKPGSGLQAGKCGRGVGKRLLYEGWGSHPPPNRSLLIQTELVKSTPFFAWVF